MKLPWDEKYLKISFHAIFTFIVIYILAKMSDGATFALANLNIMFDGIGNVAGRFFSVFSPLLTALVMSYLLDPLIDFFQDKYEQFYKNSLKEWLLNSKLSQKIKNNKYVKKTRKFLGLFRFGAKKKSKPERIYKRRNAGVLLTFLTIVGMLAATVFILFRAGKDTSLSAEYVQVISRTVNEFNDLIFRIQAMLTELELIDYFSKYIEEFMSEVTRLVGGFSNSVISGLASAGSGIVTFTLALVISIYFLRDKERYLHLINDVMDTFIPARINRPVKNLLGDINSIFSDYIRGQLTDALIMAALISIFLSVIGVKFAVIIGVFSGIANLIPYFGAIIAFALSVFTAFLSGDPIKALYAAVGLVVLQQIDGMFIVPRVVGAKVELSPVLVLLSLSVAGTLFGLVGMVLAVPVCAIIKLLLSRLMKRRKQKNEQKKTAV